MSGNLPYTALIPAAGKGSRLAHLSFSKELLPIEFSIDDSGERQPKVISTYLIDHYKKAGVNEIQIILREGKKDIIEYYKAGNKWNVNISYHMTEVDFGVPFTINQAYQSYKNKNVLFGFPDILFYPGNVFSQLITYLNDQRSIDILLGLFPVTEQNMWDTVVLNKKKQITKIRIKEKKNADVKYAWIVAAWRPAFSDFLNEKVMNYLDNQKKFIRIIYW